MSKIGVLFFLICIVNELFCQKSTIEGKIVDLKNEPILSATVLILYASDSSVLRGTTTNVDGLFKIENLDTGSHILKISFIGYENYFKNVDLKSERIDLDKIVLIALDNKLSEIKIEAIATPVIQLGDTTQINANAFKTHPDATIEDLVTKMPGITAMNGEIQAQGEKVRKVLVDGKEYFGDDANAVLKNLPAEVVDKIQIFDKMSDQSETSGFDDGASYKTINIVTKPEYREGVFGRVYAGYGLEDKWNAGLTLNFFSEKRRISILGNSNNINNQNFSAEDLSGVASSGTTGGRQGGGRQGGGNENNFLVNSKNGITITNAFGINYDEKFKNSTLNGSYFFNKSNNTVVNNAFRQYITNDISELTYNENQKNVGEQLNHRINLRFDWKIDSLNSLLFQPKISLNQNLGNRILLGQNDAASIPISLLNNTYLTKHNGVALSAPIFYRHKFSKKGRTLSLNITPNYNQNAGNNNLNSYTYIYDEMIYADSLDLITIHQNNGITLNSSTVYTEPLSPKSQLMISHKSRFIQNYSNKEAFNFNPTAEAFNQFDTTLSNNFNNNYISNSLGVSIRKNETKWNVTLGLDYQLAQLVGNQIFPAEFNINRRFNNLLPTARFQYKFSKSKNIRINYRSQNSVPSISQLQNVINNNNPLQLTTGNANLAQDWQNTMTVQYAASNTAKLTSFFAMLSGTFTKNHIVKSTFIADSDTLIAPNITLSRGGQITNPTNLNGYFNIRNFNNYAFSLKKMKSNMSFNLGTLYSRTPGLVNSLLNYANTVNLGLGMVITSNISKNVDFTLTTNTTYNNVKNTLRTSLNSVFYNHNTTFKMQLYLKNRIIFQTELNHQYNSGLSESFNQNYLLWNASVALKLFKTRQGEFRLSAFDIMNQNTNINRFITETYFEDVQNNVLNRYFLGTFTYTIKQFKTPPKLND